MKPLVFFLAVLYLFSPVFCVAQTAPVPAPPPLATNPQADSAHGSVFDFNRSSDSSDLVKSGDTVSSGPKKLKYLNGQLYGTGTLQNWVREGWWTIYRDNGTNASEVQFVHGQAMQMKTFTDQGQLGGTFNLVEKEATYPGGIPAWNNYIRAAVEDKMNYLIRKKANGQVEVQFIIGKDGPLI